VKASRDKQQDLVRPVRRLERTFGDDDVYDLITKNFVPLKFDVSDSTAVNAKRQARYKAGTLPTVVYLSTDGHPSATSIT